MATLGGEPATPARPTYVRICPVCDTANPPERARCACGASLAGVDFSLLLPPAVSQEQPHEAGAGDARGMLGGDGEASRLPTPAEAPELPATQHAASREAATSFAPPAPHAEAAAQATTLCPYPDCGQPNPLGSDRCVYCNRPLSDDHALAGARPLPRALRDRYRVIEAFPATGSEADILLVLDRNTGDKAVAKLYRRGIQPDFRLLELLAREVGDTVVRVLDHGVSDGAAYELLEYVPGGTLDTLMRSGPLPKSDIRRIVQQIADALRGIHAQRILHRDLKPDNVLVRMSDPLSLALTDFGIASFASATQHFTSVARTTKYAAPEVLTGVLDAKSDWWSLGMIVLEAASGRHPFDGLSEQVMNHQLATRPIDVRSVFDDDLRLLCRGLLLRDPKRRFGADEVARWLAGDASLTVGPDAEGVATAVRPYRIGKAEATNAAELALALARNWDEARRDLARGQVARWVEQELHDHNLVRALRDAQDQRDLTDDGRLLRFLVAAAPELPPIWRGSPVTRDAVLAAARAGANRGDTPGDDAAIDWLDSLVRDDVLASCARTDPTLHTLKDAWDDAWSKFEQRWERVRMDEEAHAKRPRDVGGGTAVSFDDLVYAHPSRLALPPRRSQNATLLMGLADPAYIEALRGQVLAGLGEVAGYCPWLERAWDAAHDDPIDVVVTHALLPYAREATTQEKRRAAATASAHARTRAESTQELRTYVSRILALSPKADENLAPEALHELLSTFEGLQRACTAIGRLVYTDDESQRLRSSAEKLAFLGAQTQHALARIEQVEGTNAIFLTRQRITGALMVLGVALMLRQPLILIGLLVVATAVVAYRWYSGFHTTESALKRLRTFGLHGRTFLRATDPPERSMSADGTQSAGATGPATSAREARWWRRGPSAKP